MLPLELKSHLASLDQGDLARYDLQSFSSVPWVLTSDRTRAVLEKLSRQSSRLKDVFAQVLVGVQSGTDQVHVLRGTGNESDGVLKLFSERANAVVEIESDLVKPLLRGEDPHRYTRPRHKFYCVYPYRLVNNKTKIMEEVDLERDFPLGYEYLKKYRTELTDKRIKQKTNPKYWYSCHRARDMKVFESDRIITPEISLGCNMTVAEAGLYHNTKVYSLVPSQVQQEARNYWLGILNSKVLWWFLSSTGYVLRGGYFVFKTNYLKPFPIRTIDFSDPEDVARHDRMVTLVEGMRSLHERLTEAQIERERTVIQHQIDATDRQIDRVVYDLYGLTDEEIEIVEQESRQGG
jgi:adenine-specific DNA-methyltransferase